MHVLGGQQRFTTPLGGRFAIAPGLGPIQRQAMDALAAQRFLAGPSPFYALVDHITIIGFHVPQLNRTTGVLTQLKLL